jgi:hypothetical protein
MNKMCRRILQVMLYGWMWCLGMAFFSGCAMYPSSGGYSPGRIGPGSPPTLSNVYVSPNPTYPGSIVNIMASYVDPDADLEYGVAAVSVNGGKLSRVAFRSTYLSGILTIPVPVSYYSRSSNVQISLSIRDTAGNWSNTVSTVLSIR